MFNSATTDWITLHWLRSKEHHPVKHVSWCFDHDLTEHWTALVLWWTIKQGQYLLCDVKQKHYVVVHVSELSLGLQVLTWFIFLSSRTTAVLLRSNQNLAVEFLLLLFESIFHFFSFQPTVPEKKPTNAVSTKLPFTKRKTSYLLRKPALICLSWSPSLVKTLLAGFRRVLGSCKLARLVD